MASMTTIGFHPEARIRALVQRAGEDISRGLGYRGPYPCADTNQDD